MSLNKSNGNWPPQGVGWVPGSNPGTLAASLPPDPPPILQVGQPQPLPVIDVTLVSSGARLTINKADYNPAIHSAASPPRTPPAYNFPSWKYMPQNGGSIPIQVTMIAGGATEVIWSSAFNPSLHENPQYMANIETGEGYGQLPFGAVEPPIMLANGLTQFVAYNASSRALQPWPSAWPLPSPFKSPYEVQGLPLTLT
jgi:hypothetical protein